MAFNMEDPFISKEPGPLELTLTRKLKFGSLNKRFALPILPQASSARVNQYPVSFEQWKTALLSIKELLLNRKFRECSSRCLNLLESIKKELPSHIHPIQESALNYYAALCRELLARPSHMLSGDRLHRLHAAREYYLRAAEILPTAYEFEDASSFILATPPVRYVEHYPARPLSPLEINTRVNTTTTTTNNGSSISGFDFAVPSPSRYRSGSVASYSSLDAIFNSPQYQQTYDLAHSVRYSPLPVKTKSRFNKLEDFNDDEANKENGSFIFNDDYDNDDIDCATGIYASLCPSPLRIHKVQNTQNTQNDQGHHRRTSQDSDEIIYPLVPSPLRPRLKPTLVQPAINPVKQSASSPHLRPRTPKRASAAVTFTDDSTAWLRMRSRQRLDAYLKSFAEMLQRHIDAVEELIDATTKAQAIHRENVLAGETQNEENSNGGKKKTDKQARIARLRAVGWQRPRFDAERYERLCQAVLEDL